MGYRELIQDQVNKAFQLIGNLTVDAILIKKLVSDFSFEDGEVNIIASSTKTVKAILLDNTKTDLITNTIDSKILVKTEDIPDIDVYDKIKINNVTWNIKLPMNTDLFTTEITLSRGI